MLPPPAMPPLPAAVPHDHDLRVRYAETDQMGVVYHANYLAWCEVGRVEWLRARGVAYRDLEAGGVALAVAEASLRFLAPARYDDLIRVRTTLEEVRSRQLRFRYEISRPADGARLVEAHTALVSIDPHGRLTTIPREVRARLTEGGG
jgi:acyl-CoA thioester hydrolase